jgi:hypothetical protein
MQYMYTLVQQFPNYLRDALGRREITPGETTKTLTKLNVEKEANVAESKCSHSLRYYVTANNHTSPTEWLKYIFSVYFNKFENNIWLFNYFLN